MATAKDKVRTHKPKSMRGDGGKPPINGSPRPLPVDVDLAEEEPTVPGKLPLAPGVKYRRILLKLSGEALMGGQKFAIDPATLAQIADELIDVHSLGVEIALVIGGGNIFRGVAASSRGMDRPHAD